MTANQLLMSETDVKSENLILFCQCCLTVNNLKSMTQSFVFDTHVEVYSKMLARCFSIQVVQGDEGSYFICNICVTKLRQCFLFRTLVEKTQEKLNHQIEQCTTEFSDHFGYDDDIYDEIEKKTIDESQKSSHVIGKEIVSKKCNDEAQVELRLQLDTYDSDDSIPIKNIFDNLTEIPKTRKKKSKLNKVVKIKCKKTPSVKPWKTSSLKFNKKTSMCSICNETFTGQKRLTAHMGIHFPNFVCDLCGKSFVARKNLTAHLKKTHDTELVHCKICNKMLKKNSISRHELSHDSIKDKNVYTCPSCPERFDSFFKRIKHMSEIHNEKNYKYVCKFCSKEYRMSSGLSRHIRSFHLQEKKYQCEICDLAFFSNGDKRDHMVTHSGDKIHECHICLKSYARKKTLREHLRIHDPYKRYRCSICGRQFTQKCSLVGHMKVHLKESDTKVVFFN